MSTSTSFQIASGTATKSMTKNRIIRGVGSGNCISGKADGVCDYLGNNLAPAGFGRCVVDGVYHRERKVSDALVGGAPTESASVASLSPSAR